jgi:multicomponent Na+:H+ antiporter subunit F
VTVAWVAGWVALPLLVLALLAALVRLLVGPTLPDRVVALDLMTAIGIGVILAGSVALGQTVMIDIGLMVALLAFLGTAAFASYLERRG